MSNKNKSKRIAENNLPAGITYDQLANGDVVFEGTFGYDNRFEQLQFLAEHANALDPETAYILETASSAMDITNKHTWEKLIDDLRASYLKGQKAEENWQKALARKQELIDMQKAAAAEIDSAVDKRRAQKKADDLAREVKKAEDEVKRLETDKAHIVALEETRRQERLKTIQAESELRKQIASDKAGDQEAKDQKIADQIKSDAKREEAREQRKAAKDEEAAKARASADAAEEEAYYQAALKIVDMDPNDALAEHTDHPVIVQGKSKDVPSGLFAIIGNSISGKTYAYQYRIDFRKACKTPLPGYISIGEPVLKSIVAPKNMNEYRGLMRLIAKKLDDHGVVVINSMTFLFSFNPFGTVDASIGPGEGGMYKAFPQVIHSLDAFAKEHKGIICAVFNVESVPKAPGQIKGSATAHFDITEGHIGHFSRRKYEVAHGTFVGDQIAEKDRDEEEFAPIDLAAAKAAAQDAESAALTKRLVDFGIDEDLYGDDDAVVNDDQT